MSHTGYVIFYAKCPIIWSSKLQTEITLSTIETDYITLYQSLRDVIPLVSLLHELEPVILCVCKPPTVCFTIFEDNKDVLISSMCQKYVHAQNTLH